MGQDASANLDPLTGKINVKKTGTMFLIQLFTVVRTDTTLDLSQKAEKVSTTTTTTTTKKKAATQTPKKKCNCLTACVYINAGAERTGVRRCAPDFERF